MTKTKDQTVFPGALKRSFETLKKRAGEEGFVEKILDFKSSVFNKRSKAHLDIIDNRLGWIDVIPLMKEEISRIERFVENVEDDGIEHLFLCGMGGSSLAPEVFIKLFGKKPWLKSYEVIDSTAPTVVESIQKNYDLTKSLFIISSKSGKTVETTSMFRYFFRQIKDVRPLKAGNFFSAITDERTDVHHMSRRNRFRGLFLNPDDIGGRYSSLSFFGVVPLAFTKAKISAYLKDAENYMKELEENPNDNSAVELGCFLASAYLAGKDKLRFVASKKSAAFIPWIEQLVAESTGKEGKGIIPIEGLTTGLPSDYDNDSAFVYYSFGKEKPFTAPSSNGDVPKIVMKVDKPISVGAEMLKWMMATSIASILMEVNPFDEPNVAESKDNTFEFLKAPRGPRKEVIIEPLFHYGDVDILDADNIAAFAKDKPLSPEDTIRGFFDGVKKGDYVSLLCFTENTKAIESKLDAIRETIGKNFKVTTIRSFGPRYLHSLGQLFKGGEQKGHFIVFERDYANDYDIPMTLFSFQRLIKAQTKGDIAAMKKRKRPVITVNLKQNPTAGLSRFEELLKK